jgi:succinate dehydrogenase / fumarate reductase, cytochrome b subunit
MAGSGNSHSRPLSPHLQVWRWHITMATSIFHRASGCANYLGAMVLVGWLGAIAAGPEAYAAYSDFLFSWFGQLILFGLAASGCYHLANGIRHLVWDAGKGYSPKVADASGWATVIAGAVGAVIVFALAYLA